MLQEQQQLIESLKTQLHRLLKHQFGRRSELIDVDQLGLFVDGSVVVEVPQTPPPSALLSTPATTVPIERKKAVRVAKDLPRVINEVDIPECERTCKECGAAMRPFGMECSEQLHYVPASIQILETRRKKYACGGCHGNIVRAPIVNLQPLPKSMASSSLLAYLIVSKFADGLPLYRIAARLQRLGVDLSHTLMSDWLMQCAELLEDLHRRMIRKVLDSGHVFTDDTSLPLQNDDPERCSTIRAKLWVYARYRRREKPLVTYEFSRSRSQEAPLAFLKDYRGYLQADAYPGYDRLYADGRIREVACLVHARRKFVEAAELLKTPGRPHEAVRFFKALFRIERQIESLTDEQRYTERQRCSVPILKDFKTWLEVQALAVLPKSALGEAVGYTLRHWEALCRYTEAGYLEASNNFAEQCMRTVAVGRKAFLFVGSERAGHAAAIYYSIVQSCKVNHVNPLSYLTYVLKNVRNRAVTLPTPDDFTRPAEGQLG
jgi:transposase